MDRPSSVADTVAAGILAGLPPDSGTAAVRRGNHTVVGVEPDEVVTGSGTAALEALDALPPGIWVGWCAFELGHAVERVVGAGATTEPAAVPDVVLARFGASAWIGPGGGVTIRGDGAGRSLLVRAARDPLDRRRSAVPPGARWRSSLDRHDYAARVDAIIELLRAGECYQVNLTRRLTADGRHDPVALYAALAARHPAPHLGMLRLGDAGGDVAVVCASPERFLSWDRRNVETRPIKGTHRDPERLRGSAKDHAENVMIVDLARNDLGRVCEPGSVRVPALCAVESHPGLHHLVSTVRGRLRTDVGTGALVAATFPPASVTGAPKPRVLEVIEELEPVRRGVYCGAFGWIDTERGAGDLALAIRTFTLFDDRAELGVGAGIVADSVPDAEWDETELKAARLLAVAGSCELVPA